MSTQAHARHVRDLPYKREADRGVQERMERQVTMPKDLPGLLRWFEEETRQETPDALHSGTVWRDRVAPHEADSGIKPVGASDTGALAYADDFRRRLENGPSEVDRGDPGTDGRAYFFRPISAAISRVARQGKPLMARHLMHLANAGFDWRKRAELIGWAHEEYEVYIREALIRLWREHREWVRSD